MVQLKTSNAADEAALNEYKTPGGIMLVRFGRMLKRVRIVRQQCPVSFTLNFIIQRKRQRDIQAQTTNLTCSTIKLSHIPDQQFSNFFYLYVYDASIENIIYLKQDIIYLTRLMFSIQTCQKHTHAHHKNFRALGNEIIASFCNLIHNNNYI